MAEENKRLECPKCQTELEHIPEYFYCPKCLDKAYNEDGKVIMELE